METMTFRKTCSNYIWDTILKRALCWQKLLASACIEAKNEWWFFGPHGSSVPSLPYNQKKFIVNWEKLTINKSYSFENTTVEFHSLRYFDLLVYNIFFWQRWRKPFQGSVMHQPVKSPYIHFTFVEVSLLCPVIKHISSFLNPDDFKFETTVGLTQWFV